MPTEDPGPSKLGGGMIVAACLLALLLLSFGFQRFLDQEQHPNQGVRGVVEGTGVIQVVLRRNRAGHYLADGQINGAPVRFLLDTGATHVALSSALARRLDLPLGASSLSRTANGLVESRRTRLERVELGGIVRRDVSASVLPNMAEDEVLLGMSFLKHLELIQSGDQLVLRARSN